MQYHARDLIMMDDNQKWAIPSGTGERHRVIFDDGELDLIGEQIIYSLYYWRLHREFPGAAILKSHALSGKFTSGVHLRLGARVFWDVFYGANKKYPLLIWDMSRVFYEIGNTVYNDTCTRLSEYVTTGSLVDIMEVLNEPKISQSKEEYLKTVADAKYDPTAVEGAIKKRHSVVSDVLYGNAGEISENGIKKLCQADIVSKGQMLQLIGPRGYVSDIDGNLFPYPIDNGYSEGLLSLYDSATESRSASRALFMNTQPLQQSEYFNREMQLLCSVIHSVVGDSCTGYVTVPWLVSKEDLPLLKGKYHMVDGKTELIWDTVEPFIGKVVQLRSITGCNNHDPQTICATCLGWSSTIMQPRTNVGFSLGTILCAIISQLMLSTKHFEGTSSAMYLDLNEASTAWLRHCRSDRSRLKLQKNVVKKNPIIRLDISAVKQLNNILSIDVSELPPSRITCCYNMAIVDADNEGNPAGPFEEVKLELAGSGAFLTTEVLQYLKEHGWVSHPQFIEFQLKNWDSEVAILATPKRGDNVHLYLKEVKSFLMPQKDSETKITDFRTRGAALSEFVTLLRKRLDFNIIQAEIFIRACMTVDWENLDYRLPLPRGGDRFEFASAKHCLYNRSLTALLAYQGQPDALLDPNWFDEDIPRMQHMLDPVIEGIGS